MVTSASRILAATRPEDVFGPLGAGSRDEQLLALRRQFRRLAAEVHPDKAGGSSEAFVVLQDLHAKAQRAVLAGVYGRAEATYARLSVRGRDYELVALAARGDVANVFLGTVEGEDGDARPVALKVAREDRHSHLLKHEARILRRFADDDCVEPRFRPYVPELIDSFLYRRATVNRAALALAALEGFYTLEQVRAAYPDGVGWRDMAWMLRRLFVAVGFAHANGVVHAGVLPPHVMIHPELHGLVLVDWKAAVTGDGLVEVVSKAWREWYPAEVLDREQPGPETDILLAVRCAVYVLGGDPATGRLPDSVPQRIRAFLRGCSQEKRSRRPDDAWGLLEEFDAILGRRRFTPFKMPGGSGTPAAAT